MANILYGVNGEGSGHSTRAQEVLSHLKARGHEVHVASFDRGLRNLRDNFEVTEIHGLRLSYVNNQVRRWQKTWPQCDSAPEVLRLCLNWLNGGRLKLSSPTSSPCAVTRAIGKSFRLFPSTISTASPMPRFPILKNTGATRRLRSWLRGS